MSSITNRVKNFWGRMNGSLYKDLQDKLRYLEIANKNLYQEKSDVVFKLARTTENLSTMEKSLLKKEEDLLRATEELSCTQKELSDIKEAFNQLQNTLDQMKEKKLESTKKAVATRKANQEKKKRDAQFIDDLFDDVEENAVESATPETL